MATRAVIALTKTIAVTGQFAGFTDPGRDPGRPHGTRVSKYPGINIPNSDGWRYRQTSFSIWYLYHSSFLTPSADTQVQGEPLQRGTKYMEEWEKFVISTEIAVYLGNGMR